MLLTALHVGPFLALDVPWKEGMKMMAGEDGGKGGIGEQRVGKGE